MVRKGDWCLQNSWLYPFELKIIQVYFEHVERSVWFLGKAGAALGCWLTVDILVLAGMVVVVPRMTQ